MVTEKRESMYDMLKSKVKRKERARKKNKDTTQVTTESVIQAPSAGDNHDAMPRRRTSMYDMLKSKVKRKDKVRKKTKDTKKGTTESFIQAPIVANDHDVVPERTSVFVSMTNTVREKVRRKKRKEAKKSKKKVEPIEPLAEILDDCKREADNNILRQYLGIDNYGLCLSHPNQSVIRIEDAVESIHACPCCLSFDDGERNIVQERIMQRKQWNITSLPLNRCPFFYKYFAMLEVGVPLEDVQNKCFIDGQHPLVLELNPEESIAEQYVPTLQASINQANELIFVYSQPEENEQQVQRVLSRRVISERVSDAIDKKINQFREKESSSLRKSVATIIPSNRFSKKTDGLLFDDSKIEGEYNNSLRMNLGMDNFGKCLRHPNHQICSERCFCKLAAVQVCRICKSERLAGGKYNQPKELGSVVLHIKKLQ